MNVKQLLPIAGWLSTYRTANLSGDLTAGLITAIMLIPQGMAYALLAGLPPQAGLYASVAPLVLYAVFGSSRTLSVGPVAIVSLLTATALGGVVQSGTADYVAAALVLALEVGLISLLMAGLRVGVLVNFISHPVISGFTSAAAILIGLSNLKDVLGISVPRSHSVVDLVTALVPRLPETNPATAAIGVGGILMLFFLRGPVRRLPLRPAVAQMLARVGPFLLVALTTALVAIFDLSNSAGVKTVGYVPSGIPELTLPAINAELMMALLPSALMIAAIGFLESVSVAKALAAKRREKIDANRELVGLGAANVAAALTGGYPVTGGFGRSNVNFDAGAATQLSAIFTAVLVVIALIFLPPLFQPLPLATLGAIIIVSVSGLIDIGMVRKAWLYNRADAIALLVTFAGVLLRDVETGILIGLATSVAQYLWRTSKPHFAIVGRVGKTEHFRNIKRHQVETYPQILAIRVDESLYFANTRFLEDTILSTVADRRDVRHVVLICSAVNFIDLSALESLETLIHELRDAGVTLHLAEVKGPVMDQLMTSDLIDRLAPGQVFLSTHSAMETLRKDSSSS